MAKNNNKKSGFNKSKSKRNNKYNEDSFDDSNKRGNNAAGRMCNWRSRDNDWRWYALNDQLLYDYANKAYGQALGSRLHLGQYGAELNNVSFPGIMTIHTLPTIGNAQDANAPVNVAMRNIYSYIRHANSGAANYDSPDMMIYLLAMGNLYAFHSWMKRIYGVMNTFSTENRYVPKAFVQAMNVDFDNIQANLADFRGFINVFANKIGSMCVPASMSYFAKHVWLYEGLYYDGVSSKAQTYMFNPYGFGYYDLYDASGTGDSTRSVLKFMPMTNRQARFTLADIIEIANTMLSPILASQDANIISGDILKAFGPENIVKVDNIPESYSVVPTYSEEVLDQIQNTTMMGDLVAPLPNVPDMAINRIGSILVDQATDINSGYLTTPIQFTLDDEIQSSQFKPAGLNYLAADKIVTFQYENVTTANTIEATRMTNCATVGAAATKVNRYSASDVATTPTKVDRWLLGCPTMASEVACFARIYYYGIGSAGTWTLLNTEKFYTTQGFAFAYASDTVVDLVPNNDVIKVNALQVIDVYNYYNLLLTKITQFDRHPALVPVMSMTPNVDTTPAGSITAYRSQMNGLIFDVDKWAIFTPQELINLAEVALLSEFNVRQFGKSSDFTEILF